MPYKILNLILYSSHRPKSTPDPKDYDQRSEGDFNSNEYIDMYSILRNYLQTYLLRILISIFIRMNHLLIKTSK